MPPIEEADLNETVTLWRRKRYDKFNNAIVASPVEIDVKWEQSQTPGFDPQARPINFDAQVQVVDSVPSGSILWRGRLADWTGSAGNQDDQLMQVATKDDAKDVRSIEGVSILRLRRFRSTLPTVEP